LAVLPLIALPVISPRERQADEGGACSP